MRCAERQLGLEAGAGGGAKGLGLHVSKALLPADSRKPPTLKNTVG